MIYLHLHYFIEECVSTDWFLQRGGSVSSMRQPSSKAVSSCPLSQSQYSLFPGDPPQAAAWIGQCILYLLIMVFEKTVISLVLLIPGWTKVSSIFLAVAVVVSFCQLCLIHDSHY